MSTVRSPGASSSLINRGPKVAETLAQEIVREIAARGLAPGTLLPSEAQMLERYGVGRGSLREALRILEVHGLITMKPGRNGGPMVKQVGPRDFGRMSSLFLHVAGASVSQLIDARVELEPVMARLAAQRQSLDTGQMVHGEQISVEDDGTYLDAARGFHQTVASLSANPVLMSMAMGLEDLLYRQISGALFPKSKRREVLTTHDEIADAIRHGRADEAERLMREHMEDYADHARRRKGSVIREVVTWT